MENQTPKPIELKVFIDSPNWISEEDAVVAIMNAIRAMDPECHIGIAPVVKEVPELGNTGVLCGICNEAITSTGTALDGTPCHIKCYHQQSALTNHFSSPECIFKHCPVESICRVEGCIETKEWKSR